MLSIAGQGVERKRVALAFAAYFLLLSSYYVLRPVRDDMAVQFGASRLQWLFSGTFLFTLGMVPLIGLAVRRLPRVWLLPTVYGFLIANLAGFALVFLLVPGRPAAAAFFIWLSVFNLLVVSLFWSGCSDAFSTEESHRSYGHIAAGGTAGALAGPALTALLARHVHTSQLLLVSIILLLAATLCMAALRSASASRAAPGAPAPARIGGSVLAGIPLALRRPQLRRMMLLIVSYTTVSTLLYIELVDLAGKRYADSGERKAFFATLDLVVNGLALALQLLGTRRLVQHAGLRVALSLAPLVIGAGLLALGAWRSAIAVAALQVLHRAGEFAIAKPGREMVYTTVDAESRYKAKNFIDTAVYRASDAASGWLIAAVRTGGADPMLAVGLPVAAVWLWVAYSLGRNHDSLTHEQA
ncbi:ATP:ADP antiporter, AAA family [Noviherbaspirillum humi]|uniref:ATP:ADP antiporter, AAA family n=1 Tax=Noviherbaspirillum humi TaxID=1688639 RepID=A0A239L083_9BURK|nr:MFS transporter [Noviherbaspirillum humi]SNT22964.1 ATP:ADP antiporter, AAA family [Noviherbaspirillum humi]